MVEEVKDKRRHFSNYTCELFYNLERKEKNR